MGLVYENSKSREYSKTSRYQNLRTVINDGYRYLETYNDVKVPVSSEDIYHVVETSEAGRLDVISNNYYGDPFYWWAIALANDFIDPFTVNPGDTIRIPSLMTLSDVRNEILTRRGGPSYS